VDTASLREAVLRIPESVWQAENAGKTNRFDTLGETQHIIFRMVSDFRDWSRSRDTSLWPQWRSLLQPIMDTAILPYGYARGAFPRIMLARMRPKGIIQFHKDTNPAARWPHKIHVPLSTNPDVKFFVGRTPHHFPVGEAVEVNNLGPHAVRNDGSTNRIHLIFEYYDLDQAEPAWIGDMRSAIPA
jgi:hypothetical protein